MDQLRRLDFETHPQHASTLYLTLNWQPPSPARHLLLGLLTTKGLTRRVQHTVEEQLALFLEGTTRFLGFLRPLVASVTPLDADQLCTYLHQCVSWETHTVHCPDPAVDLDWQLTNTVWVPGSTPTAGRASSCTHSTMKTWHPEIRTTVPEALTTVPFPCRYHVRWVPLGTQQSRQLPLLAREAVGSGVSRGSASS